MSFLLSVNLAPVPPFPAGHQNWMMPDSKDVAFSSGLSYYHQCVLDTDGIVHPVTWLNMETSEGVYDFSALTATLNYAATYGKKVIARVFYKAYSATPKPLPAYILNDHVTYGGASTEGGLRANSFPGWTPRFDNAALMARFKALITAMAAAVGSHSALQGVGPDESAWSFAGVTQSGLTATMIRDAHKEICLHFQTCFPGKEIYPLINYCDFSTGAEVLTLLQWSVANGFLVGMTDTFRLPEQIASIQPVSTAYPTSTKTIMYVDYQSTGANDLGLTERMLENARECARNRADITVWYTRGGASSTYWAAAKNAMSVIG
jgi:hypothetical protein